MRKTRKIFILILEFDFLFPRSTGCGMEMKRTFVELRRRLADLICVDATTSLEVDGLKIEE